MPPSLSTRIRANLRPPARTSVRRYLDARAIGGFAVEDQFFWQLQLASGVFKATSHHRLDDTFAMIRRALPPATNLRILDVACSSGISTVELHCALSGPGLSIETIGTDITTKVMHVAVARGQAIVYDADGNILGAEIDGMLINRRPNRAVCLYHPWRVHRARRLFAAYGRGAFRPPTGAPVTEVPLVTLAVERTPGVRVVEEDLARPLVPGVFGLIRAANILNRGYFAEPRLRELVATLLTRLAPGGLLFVVRTAGKTNHGTLWRATAAGVELVERIGDGSEIAGLVEDVARARARPAGP